MFTQASHPAALDPERFGELRELYDPEELVELVEAYLSSATPVVGVLRAAADEGDATAMRDAAHRLRGGALALGALGLADAAGDVERVTAAGDPTTIAPLEAAWTEVHAALLAELAAGAAAAPGLVRG